MKKRTAAVASEVVWWLQHPPASQKRTAGLEWGMLSKFTLAVAACIPAFCVPVQPGVCVNGASVSTYESLGATGCDIGSFLFSSVSFSAVDSSGNSVVDLSKLGVSILGDVQLGFGTSIVDVDNLPDPKPGDSLTVTLGFDIQPAANQFVQSFSGYRFSPTFGAMPPGYTFEVQACIGAEFVGGICSADLVSANDSRLLSGPTGSNPSGFLLTFFVPGNGPRSDMWSVSGVVEGPAVITPEPATFILLCLSLCAGFLIRSIRHYRGARSRASSPIRR